MMYIFDLSFVRRKNRLKGGRVGERNVFRVGPNQKKMLDWNNVFQSKMRENPIERNAVL